MAIPRARVKAPGRKPVKPLVPTPMHPVARMRGGDITDQPKGPIKGKTYRSDTGGTMRILKGSLDPSQHDGSRLKFFK